MTRRWALIGGTVLTPAGRLERLTVLCEGERILDLLPPGADLPPGTEALDVAGCVVAPGFVDTHVHGGLGRNFMEASPEALAVISRSLAAGGVTSCLATTTSAAPRQLLETLDGLARAARHPDSGGVEILGVHLEGPFINRAFRGVHLERYVREPAEDELRAIWEVAGEALKVVTLAPEVPGGERALAFFVSRGVQVSLGHTGAGYEQARLALARGASRGTHVFNGMPPLHHREAGPVHALLEADSYLEVIADGHHLHFATVALLARLAGTERMVAITDAADVAGQGDGTFRRWEGTTVRVKDGRAATLEGRLAGSVLRMDRAVAHLVHRVGLRLEDALRMASETPARSIGVFDRKGSLRPGKDADVVVLGPDLSLRLTVARGRIVFDAREVEP